MDRIAELASIVTALTLAGLAGYQLADTWTTGSLFKRPIQWLKQRRKRWLLAELLVCGFCLSHWTSLACLLVLLLTDWGSYYHWPIYWLAAVKVAQLVRKDELTFIDETAEVDAIEVVDEPDDQ